MLNLAGFTGPNVKSIFLAQMAHEYLYLSCLQFIIAWRDTVSLYVC